MNPSPYVKEKSMGNPIVHFEIRSTDPDASRAFYGELFGWSYPPGGFPGYTYVDSGVPEGTIPGGISPTQGGEPMVTVFAGVDDVQATLRPGGRPGRADRPAGPEGAGRDLRVVRRSAGPRHRRLVGGLAQDTRACRAWRTGEHLFGSCEHW